jgi:quercetin dioxygenase-like cupin family protein
MQLAILSGARAVVTFACAATALALGAQSTSATKPSPLIVEKDEGERRVFRFENFEVHFTLKIDPKNGGSPHLVFNTEDLPPGGAIPTHRHPDADEIIFLQTGTARVHLGETVRDLHAGATVFIPADTWISVENIGSDNISLVGIFSEPGFEDLMRDMSAREGEKMIFLSAAEALEIRNKHSHSVVYLGDPTVDAAPQSTKASKATPLILEKNDGERRVVRGWPGHPEPGESFVLKVDPRNGGSSHLVFLTGDLAPKGEIPTHKHPSSDEIIFLQTGTARVHLGETAKDVHAGATVFIPADTWISASNIGTDAISFVALFSAPGFEDFMRAESVREGEKNVPLSKAEDAAIQNQHSHDVIYKEP